jgi:hypothetical protein
MIDAGRLVDPFQLDETAQRLEALAQEIQLRALQLDAMRIRARILVPSIEL